MNAKKINKAIERTVCVCVCDLIYGRAHPDCEASSGYLCDLKSNAGQAPFFRLNGRTIDFDLAVETSRRILLDAKYPLLTGLQSMGIKSQQLAVNLGLNLNGIIDLGLDHAARGLALSLAREGMVTATLGEMSKRSQLVLVVGCDPKRSHPRIFDRLTQTQTDVFLVVLAAAGNETGAAADLYSQVSETELEASLMILESIERGTTFDIDHLGLSPTLMDQLRIVFEQMRSRQYVVVVTGDEVSSGTTDFGSCLDSVCSWVKAVNRDVRAVCLNLRSDQNGVGAENVLTWTTGFPAAVDASHRCPTSFGLEHSSRDILERGESDAVLLFQFNHDLINGLERSARRHLFSNPAIIITHSGGLEVNLADQSKSELVEIGNLNCFPDDFVRLDDVLFAVAEENPQPRPDLSEFLSELVAKCSPEQPIRQFAIR